MAQVFDTNMWRRSGSQAGSEWLDTVAEQREAACSCSELLADDDEFRDQPLKQRARQFVVMLAIVLGGFVAPLLLAHFVAQI